MALSRIVLIAACLASVGGAQAQYPTKSIGLIVSVPPAAATDVAARLLAEQLGARLRQQIVVENKPGASSLLAANQVAKANPDGYTLLFAPSTVFIAPHVLPKGAAGGVDVMKDLVPVVKAASSPLFIAANPRLGVRNIAELAALAKKSPGITYASTGMGSPFHIAAELFQHVTGTRLTHVPYKGLGQAATDLLSGEVQTMFTTPGGVISQLIAAGKIVPLAVSQKQRSPLLPSVPTLAEAGVPGVEIQPWFALFAPARTPQAITARLNVESTSILASSDMRQRFAQLGLDAHGGSMDEVAQEAREDFERYAKVVRQFGITE
jgi:tripartite-type tricarboxylate transporter receptor subunit TctC